MPRYLGPTETFVPDAGQTALIIDAINARRDAARAVLTEATDFAVYGIRYPYWLDEELAQPGPYDDWLPSKSAYEESLCQCELCQEGRRDGSR